MIEQIVMSRIQELIDNNASHPKYGCLLHHQDSNNPNVLHYSVQINDVDSLAWAPIHCNRQKDTGRLEVWQIDWNRFQYAKWVNPLDKDKIRLALSTSYYEFHERWQYELYRFNCEHWARLVVTGDCRCFQINEFKKLQQIPVVGVAIVSVAGVITGAWEHNGYAQKMIEKVWNKQA